MEDIIGTERVEKGILLHVRTSNGIKDVLFEFRELIDMKVNALHLLQSPHKYLCIIESHRITRRGKDHEDAVR